MNAELALKARSEPHLPTTDWMCELVIQVLEGCSTHQAADIVQNVFGRDLVPSHWKLRTLAQGLMHDRDRIPKMPRRVTIARLLKAADLGWTVYQAALQLGVTACEVILSIGDHTDTVFVSHREQTIVRVEDDFSDSDPSGERAE